MLRLKNAEAWKRRGLPMRWPRDLMILWNLLDGQFGGWIYCAAGIVAAVLLHLRDKKARLWPALAAAFL